LKNYPTNRKSSSIVWTPERIAPPDLEIVRVCVAYADERAQGFAKCGGGHWWWADDEDEMDPSEFKVTHWCKAPVIPPMSPELGVIFVDGWTSKDSLPSRECEVDAVVVVEDEGARLCTFAYKNGAWSSGSLSVWADTGYLLAWRYQPELP
jgi:hypothetical protein